MVAQEGFGSCQQPIERNPPGGEQALPYLTQEGPYQRHHVVKVGLVNGEKLLSQADNRRSLLE